MLAWEDAYVRVEIDADAHLVRHTRTSRVYEDLPALVASLRAMLARTEHLERSQYALLQDMRCARGRHEPEFEQAVQREKGGISPAFRKIALLVSSAVGRLQVQRHMQQMGVPARVFLDEQEALAWLGEP